VDKRRVRRWAVLGTATAAVLALAACGDDDEGPIPQTGVRETTTTPEAPATTAAPETTNTTAASTTTTAATSTTATSTTTTTAPSA
jgi:ABC-type oligopeptide transport system substrate-binding subunit